MNATIHPVVLYGTRFGACAHTSRQYNRTRAGRRQRARYALAPLVALRHRPHDVPLARCRNRLVAPLVAPRSSRRSSHRSSRRRSPKTAKRLERATLDRLRSEGGMQRSTPRQPTSGRQAAGSALTQHNEASVSADRGRKAGLGGAPIFAEATISAERSSRPSTRWCAAKCVAILGPRRLRGDEQGALVICGANCSRWPTRTSRRATRASREYTIVDGSRCASLSALRLTIPGGCCVL